MKPRMKPAVTSLMNDLYTRLSPKQLLTLPEEQADYLQEWRGKFHGKTPAVVLPNNTEEVAEIVQLCAHHRVGIVPQGGNTGACGGASPSPEGDEILLNLSRLDTIRCVDADDFSLTAEAGCTLADIQRAAADHNRLFALDIAPAEHCQIGGNLATNCGGVNVLRYGNARQQCLGLEAVLPNGAIWHGLTRLHKDNSGYDLKNLIIGSEGTLGIITAATLKLHPRPNQTHTAWLNLESPAEALKAFAQLREQFGNAVSTCELMPQLAVDFAVNYANCTAPATSPWHLLVELEQETVGDDMQLTFEKFISTYSTTPMTESAAAWRIRKAIPYAQRSAGGSIKHDVSVAVSDVPDFLTAATQAVEARLPGIRVCAFGHLGDGNIHFNLTQPEGMDTTEFLAHWDEFNKIVHDVVADFDGSFAAEHGVGQLKTDALRHYKDPTALQIMQAIKSALDPHNIMNPDKVISQ